MQFIWATFYVFTLLWKESSRFRTGIEQLAMMIVENVIKIIRFRPKTVCQKFKTQIHVERDSNSFFIQNLHKISRIQIIPNLHNWFIKNLNLIPLKPNKKVVEQNIFSSDLWKTKGFDIVSNFFSLMMK